MEGLVAEIGWGGIILMGLVCAFAAVLLGLVLFLALGMAYWDLVERPRLRKKEKDAGCTCQPSRFVAGKRISGYRDPKCPYHFKLEFQRLMEGGR